MVFGVKLMEINSNGCFPGIIYEFIKVRELLAAKKMLCNLSPRP